MHPIIWAQVICTLFTGQTSKEGFYMKYDYVFKLNCVVSNIFSYNFLSEFPHNCFLLKILILKNILIIMIMTVRPIDGIKSVNDTDFVNKAKF